MNALALALVILVFCSFVTVLVIGRLVINDWAKRYRESQRKLYRIE